MLNFKIIFVTFALVTATSCCRPIFRIYESSGYGEDYVEVGVEVITIKDDPNLTEQGIENFFPRTCPVGVWLGYEYEGYAGSTTLVTGKSGGVHHCTYQNSGRIFKSMKIVGNPSDYTVSAVVTYQSRYNEMTDTTYFNDTAKITNPRFNSMILVGSEELELFTEENFQGESHCIGPNNGHFNNKNEYDSKNHLRNGTNLYTNMYQLTSILGREEFHSFRFGCSTK